MALLNESICTDWATVVDVELCGPDSLSAVDPYVMSEAITASSEILFNLSKRRWPGICEDVVRPCSRYSNDPYWERRVELHGDISWWRGSCGCNLGSDCGCSRLPEVSLGRHPIRTIESVWVKGAELDDAYWRVDRHSRLIRLPDDDGTNPGWPCCQRLDQPKEHEDAFEVEFTFGREPPVGGKRAAALLAAQFALACQNDRACKLPERVQTVTRQGVSLIVADPFSFFDKGRTGIYQIDLWLSSVNGRGYSGGARIISPDTHSRSRRIDT